MSKEPQMITDRDRSIVEELVRLGIWKVEKFMRLPNIVATDETEPLLEAMLARQSRDNLHHAPCCPANHYHYRRLVFSQCNCGAQDLWDKDHPKPNPLEPIDAQFVFSTH